MTREQRPVPPRGLSLLEVLVTFMVASVVLIGLGVVFTGAASDYVHWARLRESRYSRTQLETSLSWITRQVPPEGFRQTAASFTAGKIQFTDSDGLQNRTVLTYDVNRNHVGNVVQDTGDPANPRSDTWDVRSGIIFQYFSAVYHYEDDQSALNPPSFNAASTAALQTFVDDQANRDDSRLLAVGIERLDFNRVVLPDGGIAIQWTLSQY